MSCLAQPIPEKKPASQTLENEMGPNSALDGANDENKISLESAENSALAMWV